MAFEEKNDKRSPISEDEMPLRYPGQGLDEQFDKEFDTVVICFLVCGFVMAFCVLDWLYFFGHKPAPVITTTLAVVAACFFTYKFRKTHRTLKMIKLGRTGERVVGQMLEKLRSRGYSVLHDVPTGERGTNIDHVLITPQGVLVIETKMKSKPAKGNVHAWLDGEILRLGDKEYDKSAVGQALALRKWLSVFLQKETGAAEPMPVQAVLMVPGWYVKQPHTTNDGNLWLRNGNPRGLIAYLENEPERLTAGEMRLFETKLEEKIRNHVPAK